MPHVAQLAQRAIGLLLGLTAGLSPASGQTRPDESLGSERSQVIQPRPNRLEIDGGARRGANLFHSFREFNVGQEETVRFRNPAGVATIFSRVTGNNPSSILGRLGVLGDANLVLINPNGILFGDQAIVDLSGSFMATTASAVQFGGETFSAISPELPAATLTINPSALLFSATAAQAPLTQRGLLSVGSGETVALLSGANLQIDGGLLSAPDGRVELRAVQSPTRAEFTGPADFQLPNEVPRGNVQLENQAIISVAGQGAGSISIQAGNLTLNNSTLRAGVNQPSRLSGAELGGIVLDVTGDTLLSNANILNLVPPSTPGNSGSILIRTGSLRADSSLLDTTNLGFGQAGEIQIRAAGTVVLAGPETRVRAATNRGLSAAAGDIRIETQSLTITGGARLISSTFGQGDAGDITIVAPSRVLLEGSEENRLGGGLYSTVERNAVGNGGAITVQTGDLIVRDGSSITARSLGDGNSGSILITATGSVRLSGTSSDPQPIPSGLFSGIEPSASGQGGDVRVQAESLRLDDGAQIQANLLGIGSSGDVVIRVAQGVTLDGARSNAGNNARSAIFTSVGAPNAIGPGGDIRISASFLRLLNGAQLVSSTQGRGDAGTVQLQIGDTLLLDQGASIFTNVLPRAIGSSGAIEIRTGSLEMQQGAQIASSSAGRGNAGNIVVTARDRIALANSEERFLTLLQSSVQDTPVGQGGNVVLQTPQLTLENSQINAGTSRAVGQGGDIAIQAERLTLNRSQITTQSDRGGNAGEISAVIADRLIASDSNISTSAAQTSGGRIDINAGAIRLLGDSDIRTEVTGGQGGAGDIELTAGSIIAFDDSDILAFANERGGQIQLNTPIFFGASYQPASSAINPGELDNNSQVDVNANARIPGNITLPDTSFIQNSLADLPANAIDTESLLANSCIARTQNGGTFLITGSGNLPPNRPGSTAPSAYPTDTVRSTNPDSPAEWQPGNSIVEPEGVYRLPNGELILSHQCRQ